MSTPLIECIPNFSDARRPEVIQAIQDSIKNIPGVLILDQHSDLDHNRTVITYIGSPAGVEEAAFQAISTAAKLIDLNNHTGEHPRVGATDVVPFVPIRNCSMQDCIEIAQRLGKRVAAELNIPVYLYEEAASIPERQNLENIRRGEFEGLRKEIKTNPARQPDFGPTELGPAGATVIGARQPLIAFNAYLTTDDVSIAQKISRTIRHSSGGLRFVKAMGVLVEGRAQVSMNLTHFRQTAIPQVVEMIRSEARRYGVAIHHCELVGMIPQDALINSAIWYLQLDDFKADQILEHKISAAVQPEGKEQEADDRFKFLDELASSDPTPGGGSAAAFSAAEAASLAAMVARVTVGKKKYADVEGQMRELIVEAETLRAELKLDVDRDAQSYQDYIAAVRLPKDTPEQIQTRNRAMQAAMINAAQIPLETARHTFQAMQLAFEAALHGNINALSDSASAASLARAAVISAGLNVRTNLSGIEDENIKQELTSQISGVEEKTFQLYREFIKVIEERGNLTLPVG